MSKNVTHLKVLSNDPAASKMPARPSPSIGAYLIFHPDKVQAEALVAQQSRLEFDSNTNGQLAELSMQQANLETDLASHTQHLAQVRQNLDTAKEFIRASTGEEGTPFGRWPIQDRATLVLASLTSIAVVATGCSNVFANLMSAGIPVFLEHPALAWTLSAIVPAGAFVLHAGVSFLDLERTRRTYAKGIFAATGILLLIWTVLFAMNFSGVSGSFDVLSLGESSGSATAFVWVQLASEIVIAAALFLVIESLCAKHQPDHYARNPEHEQLATSLQSAVSTQERLRNELTTVIKKRSELEAAKEAATNLAVANFLSQRARFDAFHSDIQ